MNTAKKKHDGSVEVLISADGDPEEKNSVGSLSCSVSTLDKGYCESLWAFLDKKNFPVKDSFVR